MQKRAKLYLTISVLVMATLISVMAQTNTLPFAVTPEETGEHDGNHQFPDFVGSIQVGDESTSNYTDLAIVTKGEAEAIAINYTHGGNVISSQLGEENGYLVWKVNVNFDGTTYEILVDAGNGKVLFASTADPGEGE